MRKRLPLLVLPLAALVLEILPFGAVCNFALPATDGSIGRFRQLYSYFDLIPFGYANFAPLITAVITCAAILVLAIYCFSGKEILLKAAKNIFLVSAAVSLGPLVLGFDFFSVVGALISLSLIAEFIVLYRRVRASDN